jgi:hypothetical protein
MGVLGKIFGSDRAVEGLKNGLDKSFFTTEEKADYFKDLLKLYEPFRLIQRILASMITGVYLSVWVVCAIVFLLSLFFDPCSIKVVCKASQIESAAFKLAEWNNELLGTSFLTINSLYFGGGLIEGAVRSFKKQQ